MIRFILVVLFVAFYVVYLTLIFAWRHTIRPIRFWLTPTVKVLVRSVIR